MEYKPGTEIVHSWVLAHVSPPGKHSYLSGREWNRQTADAERSKSDIGVSLPLGITKYLIELMYHLYYRKTRTTVIPLTICLSPINCDREKQKSPVASLSIVWVSQCTLLTVMVCIYTTWLSYFYSALLHCTAIVQGNADFRDTTYTFRGVRNMQTSFLERTL
jgi:hypothetical protein